MFGIGSLEIIIFLAVILVIVAIVFVVMVLNRRKQ